jgi:hypothetical protein
MDIRTGTHKPNNRHRWLLRARHYRPSRRAAKPRDELAPLNPSLPKTRAILTHSQRGNRLASPLKWGGLTVSLFDDYVRRWLQLKLRYFRVTLQQAFESHSISRKVCWCPGRPLHYYQHKLPSLLRAIFICFCKCRALCRFDVRKNSPQVLFSDCVGVRPCR